MEKTENSNKKDCCMKESALLEVEGFFVCTTCGSCKNDTVFESSSHKNDFLGEVSSEIGDICENGGIPKRTEDIANRQFFYWHKKIPTLSPDILKAAVIYNACKKDGYPRSLREISSISGISSKKIGKYDSIISQIFYQFEPDIYVNRFCCKLGKSLDFIKKTGYHAQRLACQNKSNPITITASAIYLTYLGEDNIEKNFLKKLQNLTGVAPSTILRSVRSFL